MQTVQSPVQAQKISIEKLIQIPVEKVKEKLLHLGSEERIRYAGMLFEGNGWTVAYHRKGQQADSLLLSYPKSPDNIVLMVRIDAGDSELSYEDVREHLLYFENELSPQYQCRQFCLIAFNDFESKAEHLEDFNLLLQKWSYVEELHLNYSSDKIREPRIQLFAHNKQTYKKVQRMMQTTNAIAVVQATGTGKSYLIAKLLQDFNGTKRLVMAPSTFIIEQIKEHIRWEVDKIQFMTYAKGMNLSESEIKALQPGLIVFDEFHRCGADEWGRGVQNIINAFPNAFKFGTSATPIRYLDNRRDMAKELFEGNIAENLSLAQAITRSILPMPKYVCALYTLKEEANNLRELIKRSRKNEEAKQKIMLELDTLSLDWERSNGIPQVLKKHLRKHMSKFIVFCENEKHLLETEPMVVGWFKEALRHADPENSGEASHPLGKGDSLLRKTSAQNDVTIKTYRIYDGEPKSEQILEDFKKTKEKDTLHLLFSINMLNEGLHVNEVSGVVLLRPTESPNIFYQQIGRCLKVGASHTPVIFDFVNNFKSVRTHDFMYDLQEAKRFFADTRKDQDLKDLCPEFSIIDEVREITEVFGEIEFKVEDWEAMYERLVEFKSRFGHCEVPKYWKEDQTLANWIRAQRKKCREGLLDKERAEKIIALGVELRTGEDMRDEFWQQHFDSLSEFRKIFGHLNVNKRDEKYGHLAHFIKSQRYRYKIRTLEDYRIKKLESIGFEWGTIHYTEGQWQQYFDELIAFKNQYGHFYPFNTNLAQWVANQRLEFRKNTIDTSRKQKLDSIGFDWQTKTTVEIREDRIKLLEKFYRKYGHSNVLEKHIDFAGLAIWLRIQRKAYRDHHLPDDIIQRMNDLKVDWNFQKNQWDQAWEMNCNALFKFHEERGHASPSEGDGHAYRKLYLWTKNVRKYYKEEKLSAERIAQLNALNFQWNVLDANWDERYQQLIAFKEKNGHTRVSVKSKQYGELGKWCVRERMRYKEGKLFEDRKKRLEVIGFAWDALENRWYDNYDSLKQFLQNNDWNDLNSKNKRLATWVSSNRDNYRKGKLADDKTMLLNMLGIEWVPFTWDPMYQQLVKYKEKFGRNYVLVEDKEFGRLGRWCASQRQAYKRNELSPEQIKLLNDIEFPWVVKTGVNVNNSAWNCHYQQLSEYLKEHGTSRVLTKSNPKLAHWCGQQRRDYQQSNLSPERVTLLQDIGFSWKVDRYSEINMPRWMSTYNKLVHYLKEHKNNFKFPTEGKENRFFAGWCNTQRASYRENKLSEEQIRLLDNINFPWQGVSESHWDAMYMQLLAYKEEHGSPDVRIMKNKYAELTRWCQTQRDYYRNQWLLPEQLELLNALGFSWDGISDPLWNKMYQQLLNYRDKYGSSHVPIHDERHKELGQWCTTQRKSYRAGKLTEDRLKLLNDVLFDWIPKVNKEQSLWRVQYNELIKYKEKHGSAHVPVNYSINRKLGGWCNTQRDKYRKNRLDAEKLKLLNDLGFPWEIKAGSEPKEDLWNEMYARLVSYKQQTGKSWVSEGTRGYEKLARWCLTQRGNFKKNKLLPERLQLLTSIGFSFNSD